MTIQLESTKSNTISEPLIRPFGFKGGFMTEIWHSIFRLVSSNGIESIGLGTQNVLWSDANVFSANSEKDGNALMYAISEKALSMIRGKTFSTPIDLQEAILDDLYSEAKKITRNPDLRMTFVLNALVGIDNAAWVLYARENQLKGFDEIIPEAYRPALAHHHNKVASIPLMAYNIPMNEILDATRQGFFFMKIQIGQPGTQEEMLQKDMARISEIHQAIGAIETPHTADGKLPYYFDANGRYESKELLLRLIDHAEKIGALEQIQIIEEPFPEELEIDVSDIPVRLAADESAHTDVDALKRIEMGYGSIALKPIAKTMSMSMKIAQLAHERNVPCFCADLTVNPVLVEWNKAVACRLAPFPGLEMGLVETNGHQNYANWDKMRHCLPYREAAWSIPNSGVFNLDEDYYAKDGGILENPKLVS